MTPERGMNTGPDSAAVGLGYEESPSAGDGESLGDSRPGQAENSQTTTGDRGSEDAEHQGHGPEDAEPAGPAPGGSQTVALDGAGSVKKAEFQQVSNSKDNDKTANLDLLLDVVVPVSVELGRTSLTVKDILSTYQGSVIELDRAAGEPVDIMVGGKPLAKGEVVVVKQRFGVRVTELVGSIEGVEKA